MQVETPAEKLLFTTVRVETEARNGERGTGTGFFFQYTEGGEAYPFIVSNKHVVAGAKRGWITFHRAGPGNQPVLGSAHRIEITDCAQAWHGHTDPEIDVAVMPCAPILELMGQQAVTPFCQWIDRSITAGNELFRQLDALEEVVFIGYPNGIWDERNFLPITRRGTTATHMLVDFQGKKQFLIDASVFPGSSGSPVFLYNRGIISDRQGNGTLGVRLAFLGVVAAVFFRQDLNEIRLVPQVTANLPVALTKEMIDLGIVFKAETVLETIEDLLKSRGVVVSRA